jgi:hypothetical protein
VARKWSKTTNTIQDGGLDFHPGYRDGDCGRASGNGFQVRWLVIEKSIEDCQTRWQAIFGQMRTAQLRVRWFMDLVMQFDLHFECG